MASVHHYLADAHTVGAVIREKFSELQDYEKEAFFAAMRLQRVWRGYCARKIIKNWHKAALVIQKNIRGWLCRLHLPEIYQYYYDYKLLKHYNKNAAKIQACWRGYFVRKKVLCIKDVLEERRKIEEANEAMRKKLREAFENAGEGKKGQKLDPVEEEAKNMVLYILFRAHHLIRTQEIEGIYSLHGKKELSSIEKMLKAVPFKEYMKNLRKLYNKSVNAREPRHYIFKDKKYQIMEDLYRMNELKKDRKVEAKIDKSIHEKDFVLTRKIEQKPYEKSIYSSGKYQKPLKHIPRESDSSRNIASEKFDLYPKMFKARPKIPPYYIDFWTKTCGIHNLPEFQFDD